MKSTRKQHGEQQRKIATELYSKHAGNTAAVAREMGIYRSTVYKHLKSAGVMAKKPLAGGKRQAKIHKENLPTSGIKRYILTSAQNNTYIHKEFWENLTAMAKHYDAQIMVGTFSYNQNKFGKLAVKQGTEKPVDRLWR